VTEGRWVDVCRLAELSEGEVLRVPPPLRLAVYNAGGGQIYAIDDMCTHEETPLSDGWFENCYVECPLHGSRFDLRTGEPDGFPATEPVRTYSTEVVDGVVRVDVTDSSEVGPISEEIRRRA
jgi:3-phenylpropionate/trans-cinnamate dioxygenase ferredoxin subunit